MQHSEEETAIVTHRVALDLAKNFVDISTCRCIWHDYVQSLPTANCVPHSSRNRTICCSLSPRTCPQCWVESERSTVRSPEKETYWNCPRRLLLSSCCPSHKSLNTRNKTFLQSSVKHNFHK